MNQGLIPSRYAKALFEFASEKKADRRIYDLMHALESSFASEPSLQQAVGNPFHPCSRQDETPDNRCRSLRKR